MRKRGREAVAKWSGLISEQKQSGQSVAAFCGTHGVSTPRFYAWKKRLSQTGAEEFLAVQVVGVGELSQPAAGSRAIEIRLGGGRSVMVEPGFDAGHLRALLAVLEARA